MARAKKAPRILQSKYGISQPVAVAEVKSETVADILNMSFESMTDIVTDKVARLSRLKLEAEEAIQSHRTKAKEIILSNCKAAVPDHIKTGDRYVDCKGVVQTISEETITHQMYEYNQEPRSLRALKAHGVGSYDTEIYEIDYWFSVMGNTLYSANDNDKQRDESEGAYLQRRMETFVKGIQNLTVENLDNAGMVKTDKPERFHFPYKRNVKGWLRNMGFNARNDSHDISYSTCSDSSDDGPCRAVTVVGPPKGSDDLRLYAKFATNCSKLSAYLTKRGLLRRTEDTTQGRGTMEKSVVTYHLELIL
jgi:hypothetical protein